MAESQGVIAGSGSAAALVQALDWDRTPLGLSTHWSVALRTAVQLMLASGHAMCLVWGEDRTLLYNEAYIPMLGQRHPHAMGMPIHEVWPEIWDAIAPLIDAAYAGESSTFQNMPLVMTRHGVPEETWWTFSYSPIRDDDGQVAGMLNVTLETTAQVAAEQERDAALRSLMESQNKLSALLVESEEQVRQLQKLDALGKLTSGVAHDFNNLLTVIQSSADLLRCREDLTREQRNRYVDTIASTTTRAGRLTQQLLTFARRKPTAVQAFDVSAKVHEVCDMLGPIVGGHIKVAVVDKCPSCEIAADASQFETALINLAVNARDAMHHHGRLTITVETAQRRWPGPAGITLRNVVAVSVADSGTGIAPEQLPRIFEPFFTTKAEGKGTGLGLSQVHDFVHKSGGEVVVDSTVGVGTTLTLFLRQHLGISLD